MSRPFATVDVFTEIAYRGNPLAVVVDGDGLDTEAMQRFANWTNLSETAFLLPPTTPEADYRVRIFTTAQELPFAGHPTLGACHAWLGHGGTPRHADRVVQECGVGLVEIRRDHDRLAFAAPPLLREGPVDEELLGRLLAGLGLERSAVVDAAWIDNGPGWIGILLGSAEEVLAVEPGSLPQGVGLIGPYPEGAPAAFEVRAVFPGSNGTFEDPVTGSLNASAAQWLIGSGRAVPPYRVTQGARVGRAGVVRVHTDVDGQVWIGGHTVTCVTGTVAL
jgi:PhzF family phenazine biosynthesis protein